MNGEQMLKGQSQNAENKMQNAHCFLVKMFSTSLELMLNCLLSRFNKQLIKLTKCTFNFPGSP